jgi:TonB family protein
MKSLLAILLLSASTVALADPLAVRVTVYQRTPQNVDDGTGVEPELPGTLIPAPNAGWPSSYDAVRQALTARKRGRLNVMLASIYPAKQLTAEQSAAFFINELGRPAEVKADGDVLLPNGKHTTIPVAPNTTAIFGASDEQYYVAVSILPASAVRDDVVVIMNGEKPLNLVKRVEPKYPSIEAMKHRSGIVVAQLRIEPDGSVGDVNVLQKVQPLIDAAAVDAFKQWRFEPPQHDGKPVTAYMVMTSPYRIE